MNRILLASVFLLGACDHYSNELASLDGQYKSAPVQVAATTQDLNAIETAAGGGASTENFNQTLARDYYALARYENDHAMDYKAAQYFTGKAKAATMGKEVQPGNPRQFDIPKDQQAPLIEARSSLVSALQTQRSPQTEPMLAKAVVCYDCWLDQAEEGKTGAAATCADSFNQALSNLTMAMNNGSRVSVPFQPHQTALANHAGTHITQIVTALQGTTPATTKLFIESEDTTLSRARAAALRSVLQFNGVDPAYIIDRPASSASPVSLSGDAIGVSIEQVTPYASGI